MQHTIVACKPRRRAGVPSGLAGDVGLCDGHGVSADHCSQSGAGHLRGSRRSGQRSSLHGAGEVARSRGARGLRLQGIGGLGRCSGWQTKVSESGLDTPGSADDASTAGAWSGGSPWAGVCSKVRLLRCPALEQGCSWHVDWRQCFPACPSLSGGPLVEACAGSCCCSTSPVAPGTMLALLPLPCTTCHLLRCPRRAQPTRALCEPPRPSPE